MGTSKVILGHILYSIAFFKFSLVSFDGSKVLFSLYKSSLALTSRHCEAALSMAILLWVDSDVTGIPLRLHASASTVRPFHYYYIDTFFISISLLALSTV
jgi:hypothetical protein